MLNSWWITNHWHSLCIAIDLCVCHSLRNDCSEAICWRRRRQDAQLFCIRFNYKMLKTRNDAIIDCVNWIATEYLQQCAIAHTRSFTVFECFLSLAFIWKVHTYFAHVRCNQTARLSALSARTDSLAWFWVSNFLYTAARQTEKELKRKKSKIVYQWWKQQQKWHQI